MKSSKGQLKKILPRTIVNLNGLITRKKKVKTKITFTIDIVEHCNLRCKGCDHFSSIAKPFFMDVEVFRKDMTRMKYIFGNSVEKVSLIGGEPLLHSEISIFCSISRELFPQSVIQIISNGTLLNKMPGSFFEVCIDNNILLNITLYPIKFDYDNVIKSLIDKYPEIKIEYYGNTNNMVKSLYRVPIDISGHQNANLSYALCRKGNECVSLRNGKIYPCTFIPNLHIFNEYFDKNLIVSKNDGIDIYDSNNAKEIMERLAHPFPACRYCDNLHFCDDIPWETSKGEIDEWV